ncbi:MAG: phosphate ABC transporter permease PstA [Beijerinckiaceae bacterium]|nr:phosphate ABC transporter permease PstA [Beijerinckiaceae bacterium]MCZ8299168.1 phosphate ABC transporter permease PstA [Beijerinckiaceae bacterium]
MTDTSMAPPETGIRTFDYGSDEAQARVKRRYKTEARFKLYGLLAVLFAGAFVFVLLADIVRKGMPAFFEHRVVLTLDLDASLIDPTGRREIDVLRNADYNKIVMDAWRANFPEVTQRAERRRLEALVSSGAADDLRAAVIRDPALIGQKVRFPVLLSDDADLHFKGLSTRISAVAGAGALDVKVNGREVELNGSGQPFAAILADVKAGLMQDAERVGAELARLPASQQGGNNAALDARRIELTQKVAELRRRAGDAGSAETIDFSAMPSRIIRAEGAAIRLQEIGPGSAKGFLLVAPQREIARLESWTVATFATPESNRKASDADISWLETLNARGAIEKAFATRFFSSGDSREPELAGIRGALIGSALTLLVTLIVCLPLGVGAAVYLEEFAPKNRFTDILEVNINNLAAVPSIVFGLLGLAMFLNFFGLPRSAPLVGGLVLALLVLPTIIIASRAALKAVPPSIKEAALGVGASHQQAIFHHVLPLAMPGIMTGTIIGMAHALGETAPLLMIGMVAFIVDIPQAITDPGTVLPVQIYLWSDLPEVAFQAKTAGAILVLLGFLFVMNGAAILLRRRFERRW